MGNIKSIPGGTFSEEDHIYRDTSGMIIPSVTQTLAGLGMCDYSHIKQEVLERKSAIGVAVHKSIEFICQGGVDWNTVDEFAMPYVVAGEIWMREQKFISLSQEGQGIHEISGMKYGFAYDHLGEMEFKGRLRKVILDIKTCISVSPSWRLQTSAYAAAAPKLPAGERYLRCILQLRSDGSFRTHYYEDRSDESAWPHILFSYIWGINNGLYTLNK